MSSVIIINILQNERLIELLTKKRFASAELSKNKGKMFIKLLYHIGKVKIEEKLKEAEGSYV